MIGIVSFIKTLNMNLNSLAKYKLLKVQEKVLMENSSDNK